MTLRSVRLSLSMGGPGLACARDHLKKKTGFCRAQTSRLDELQACDGPLLLSTTTLLFSTVASALTISNASNKLTDQLISGLLVWYPTRISLLFNVRYTCSASSDLSLGGQAAVCLTCGSSHPLRHLQRMADTIFVTSAEFTNKCKHESAVHAFRFR